MVRSGLLGVVLSFLLGCTHPDPYAHGIRNAPSARSSEAERDAETRRLGESIRAENHQRAEEACSGQWRGSSSWHDCMSRHGFPNEGRSGNDDDEASMEREAGPADDGARVQAADSEDPSGQGDDPAGEAPRPSARARSSGGPVRVRGYTRKDGTYVAPHTRRAPRR